MFSQLGPLFRTHLRQAEKSDARLEIRRDEKQDQGKKQEFGEEEVDTSGLWEDSTSVSVEALKAFLVEFLKSRGDDVPEAPSVAEDIALTITPEYRPPVSNRAAQAVKAYSSMAAQTAPIQPPPEPETTAPAESVDLVSLLAADEVRTMHVLITELDALSRQGVQTLVIEKAETFLEALVLAVRAEKLKA